MTHIDCRSDPREARGRLCRLAGAAALLMAGVALFGGRADATGAALLEEERLHPASSQVAVLLSVNLGTSSA